MKIAENSFPKIIYQILKPYLQKYTEESKGTLQDHLSLRQYNKSFRLANLN
jgi:hypothetical protein